MKCLIALVSLFAFGCLNAGQPLHDVLKLRTIDVLRCEQVTKDHVAEVSSFFRSLSQPSGLRQDSAEVAGNTPGIMVEGIFRRQRDVTFQNMGGEDPIADTQWASAKSRDPLTFFLSTSQSDSCELFVNTKHVNIVLSQRAECDTYPPYGICAFDRPIRLADPEIWAKYGE